MKIRNNDPSSKWIVSSQYCLNVTGCQILVDCQRRGPSMCNDVTWHKNFTSSKLLPQHNTRFLVPLSKTTIPSEMVIIAIQVKSGFVSEENVRPFLYSKWRLHYASLEMRWRWSNIGTLNVLLRLRGHQPIEISNSDSIHVVFLTRQRFWSNAMPPIFLKVVSRELRFDKIAQRVFIVTKGLTFNKIQFHSVVYINCYS